jgi:hypothetical protein
LKAIRSESPYEFLIRDEIFWSKVNAPVIGTRRLILRMRAFPLVVFKVLGGVFE